MLPTKKSHRHTAASESVPGEVLERRKRGEAGIVNLTSIKLPLHLPRLPVALGCTKLRGRGLLESARS